MNQKHTIAKDYIAQFLPKNPRIIEAGGHIGRDTVKMARLWPEGHIYSFEPVPELYQHLCENTQQCANVTCFNVALSNRNGTAQFYKASGRSTATSSLFKPKEYLQEHPETIFDSIEVPCITLDTWAHQNSIHHIDGMWLDMQGGELAALQGATSLLPTISVIYTEVALTERYEHNPLYHELKEFLQHHGFKVQEEALGKISWGNVLFIR